MRRTVQVEVKVEVRVAVVVMVRRVWAATRATKSDRKRARNFIVKMRATTSDQMRIGDEYEVERLRSGMLRGLQGSRSSCAREFQAGARLLPGIAG